MKNVSLAILNDNLEIKLGDSKEIYVALYSKVILFGYKELGNCKLNLFDHEGKKIKKNIIFQNNSIGSIEFDINIVKETCMSTQSTCNSVDMKDDCIKDSTHLDLDIFKPMNFYSHFQDTEEDILDIEDDDKNEFNMYQFIEKVSEKKKKILCEKQELFSLKKCLEKKKEDLASEKLKIAKETEEVKEEKKKLDKMVTQLNSNFYELKNDKLRKKAHVKLIERIKFRMVDNLNRASKRKASCETSWKKKECLDYSILELSESVMPINNPESPIPDEIF